MASPARPTRWKLIPHVPRILIPGGYETLLRMWPPSTAIQGLKVKRLGCILSVSLRCLHQLDDRCQGFVQPKFASLTTGYAASHIYGRRICKGRRTSSIFTFLSAHTPLLSCLKLSSLLQPPRPNIVRIGRRPFARKLIMLVKWMIISHCPTHL